nr:MAG TPA: hypothetical protein [Caudoviricetes sp.]
MKKEVLKALNYKDLGSDFFLLFPKYSVIIQFS